MNEILQLSNLFSLAALLVSVYAVKEGRRTSKLNEQLVHRELELVRVQLTKANQDNRAEKMAQVSARMYKDGKSWRVRIYNSGPADALNVRILLDETNELVTPQAINGKLPMSRMEKGQSVDVWARVHMTSASKETLVLQWDDGFSKDRENRVEITV